MQRSGGESGSHGGLKDQMREEIERIERREARERRNRGLVYNLRAHPRITLVLFAAVGFLVWWLVDKAVETDKEMVREAISNVAVGLNRGSDEGMAMVLDSISRDFELDGYSYDTVEASLPIVFALKDLWIGRPQIGEIEIVEDKAYVKNVYIAGGQAGQKGTSSWEVTLQKEADGKWRIVGGALTHLMNTPTNRRLGSAFGSLIKDAAASGGY